MSSDRTGPNLTAGLILGVVVALVLGLLITLLIATVEANTPDPIPTSTVEPR